MPRHGNIFPSHRNTTHFGTLCQRHHIALTPLNSMKGLKVSTRRTQADYRPSGSTRAAIARRSRSGGTSNPQPQKKRSRQPPKKVEDVADEVLTPDWEARGARPDQGRGSQVDHFDVPDVKNVQAVVSTFTGRSGDFWYPS